MKTGRIDARDRRRVTSLVAEIACCTDDPRSIRATAADALPDLLDAHSAIVYGVDLCTDGFRLGALAASGMAASQRRLGEQLDRVIGSTATRWGAFNPARPEAVQRNVVTNLSTFGQMRQQGQRSPESPPEAARELGLDRKAMREWKSAPPAIDRLPIMRMLLTQHQLRVLVCDNDSLLAWVGVIRAEPFGSREVALFRSIISPLRRRLLLERHVSDATLNAATIGVLLDSVSAPAFLISIDGVIQRANAMGRILFDDDPSRVRALLARALRSPSQDASLALTRIESAGMKPHFLAIVSALPSDPMPRVSVAAQRWGLTSRESQVLAHVARGAANKSIAASLGCAESTVEVHVSRIMRKAHADGRTALVARFWTEL